MTETRRLQLGTAAIAATACYRAAALFPTPAKLLSDHGHGYQLAGASEILAGRHPFVDFKDIYGPLVHYASAAAQWLAFGRVGGELILACVAFAIGYALLFRLMLKCEIPMRIAFPAALVAIAVQPESWRYYMLLLPMLFFTTASRYVDKPGRGRLIAMAGAVTLAGLFRPDLGVFTFLAGAVLIGTAGAAPRRTAVAIGVFAGIVLLCALPWLGWLAAHGKLPDYLVNSSADAIRDAAGRARPAPVFDVSLNFFSAQNAKAYLFRLPALMLVLALAGLALRRAGLQLAQRRRLYCLAVFAALTQLQAVHIVDWMHVRDTLPVRILLLAWIVAEAGTGVAFALGRGLAAALILSLLPATVHGVGVGQFAPRAVVEKLRAYAASRAEFLAALREDRTTFRARLYEYVRDRSAPDEEIFAVIEAPQINYFADRRLAAPQLAIFPGYFADAKEQQELIAHIRTGRTAFVIVDHVDQEEYPDMSLARFAPEFHAFLERDFDEITRIGYCRVLQPRWRREPETGIGAQLPPPIRQFRE